MQSIRPFRPALYALVILGMTAFSIAAESGQVWVLGVGAVLLNLWWMQSGTFRPLPRILANAITLFSMVVLIWMIREGTSAPILLIGHFLVLLQVVKLYEQRANRDYAQLLVLGPLLVIAGAISTYSLLFGLMFIAYLFLWLYCCLLFHLKVETDLAQRTIAMPIQALGTVMARQQERMLGRSVRRITGLISVCAIGMAVLAFLFFPRGGGAGMLSPFEWKPSQALTGFNDSVNFQNLAMITQNTQEVAWVTVKRQDGQPYAGLLLLRGTTLDHYSGGRDDAGSRYQWTRWSPAPQISDIPADRMTSYGQADKNQLIQSVRLDPTGTNVLFAMGGIVSFTPKMTGRFKYWRYDEVLQAADPIINQIKYEVVSRDKLIADRWPLPEERTPDEEQYLSRIDPKIEAFARRPEVTGSDAQGALTMRRAKALRMSPLDMQIAQNMETYLRTNFTYTLDLTDASRIQGQDPLVAFLYDLKRGHCEYFAGAMTLMCQSLGMQARMVIGFRCDEYNTLFSYYTVRQSHAHAWVEVLGDDGTWHTFDPTSGREDTMARNDTLLQKMWSILSFMQYTWANAVVSYDPSKSENLIQNMDQRLSASADDSGQAMNQWFSSHQLPRGLIGSLVVLIGSVLGVLAAWLLVRHLRMRRRVKRIGLEHLPKEQQERLSWQLRFYDRLLGLLERRQIRRPAHLTPLEFSRTLDFLPVEAFGSIQLLTEAFYRVRYGRAELSGEEERTLIETLARIEPILSART